jgi:hypothetical protein
MVMVAATIRGGPMPRHEIAYIDRGSGVYMVKITSPNPGWRLWGFRDGNTMFVTHISEGTSTDDHTKDAKTALRIKGEHMANKPKAQPDHDPRSPGRNRKRRR